MWGASPDPQPVLYLLGQVSVLTDQVEAQWEKIRDLEVCLEGHQVKLNAAEEMLQQVQAGEAQGLGSCSRLGEPLSGSKLKSSLLPCQSCLHGRLDAQLAVFTQQVKPEGEGGEGQAWEE